MKSRTKRRCKFSKMIPLFLFCAVVLSACYSASTHRHPGGDPALDSRSDLPDFVPEELTPAQRAMLERFAPRIHQGVSADPAKRHWDTPTRMDFDGDWVGRNNEQSLRSWPEGEPFPAAVYYALVESETHVFLTYFLFHPLDWEVNPNFLWLGRWHENDGESVQVAVRKRDGKAVLLATQAHLGTKLYAAADEDFRPRSDWKLAGSPMEMEEGRPVVYVESGGHGIYGAPVKGRAAGADTVVFDPTDYELLPIHDTLWKMYRTLGNLGDGGMVDGAFDYRSAAVAYRDLPRHFDSDRLSVLVAWKFDAGISPFAFSHSLLAEDLGVLFFEPARKYRDAFGGGVEGGPADPWGQTYLYNPYLPAPR